MRVITKGREPLKVLLLDGLSLSSKMLGHTFFFFYQATTVESTLFSFPLVYHLVN